LTVDKVSDTKWAEILDLEKVIKQMNLGASWKDAPTEYGVLFHKRFQMFLKLFVLCGSNGILGRIEDYVCRYEIQGCNSLHAHIVLWCASEDIDRVTREICAYILAYFDKGQNAFVAPTNSKINEWIYKLVVNKQLHHYKNHICRQTDLESRLRSCKIGFPKNIHKSKKPLINESTRKWCYYRPSIEHRNVVPYHLVVLAL
jgi:hypothetical protein